MNKIDATARDANGIGVTKLHTTPLGELRIRRNLDLQVEDVMAWCKQMVLAAGDGDILRRGKNWYVSGERLTAREWFVLTINAHSHTVITAHRARAAFRKDQKR